MTQESRFALRIAFFHALGFCYTTGGVTYLDARLTSHAAFGPRHYPLGYWVCAFAPLVFCASYLVLTRIRHRLLLIVASSLVPLLCAAIVLPNFLPEFPHAGVVGYLFLYSVATFVALFARLVPDRTDYIDESALSERVKIERVKHSVDFWRTVTISAGLGYLALMGPWMLTAESISKGFLTNPAEVFVVGTWTRNWILVFTTYVLAGPMYELFSKTARTADLLLGIKQRG